MRWPIIALAAAIGVAFPAAAQQQDAEVLICAASYSDIVAQIQYLSSTSMHVAETEPSITLIRDQTVATPGLRIIFTPIRTGRFTWKLVVQGWATTSTGEARLPSDGTPAALASIVQGQLSCPQP